MRVYLDENLSPRVSQLLRARGVDATSAHEVGNGGLDDRAQLRYAAAEGRAMVTADIGAFVALDAEAIAANAAHAGVILVSAAFRRDEVDALASAIEKVMRLYPAGLPQTVVYLSRASASGGG